MWPNFAPTKWSTNDGSSINLCGRCVLLVRSQRANVDTSQFHQSWWWLECECVDDVDTHLQITKNPLFGPWKKWISPTTSDTNLFNSLFLSFFPLSCLCAILLFYSFPPSAFSLSFSTFPSHSPTNSHPFWSFSLTFPPHSTLSALLRPSIACHLSVYMYTYYYIGFDSPINTPIVTVYCRLFRSLISYRRRSIFGQFNMLTESEYSLCVCVRASLFSLHFHSLTRSAPFVPFLSSAHTRPLCASSEFFRTSPLLDYGASEST